MNVIARIIPGALGASVCTFGVTVFAVYAVAVMPSFNLSGPFNLSGQTVEAPQSANVVASPADESAQSIATVDRGVDSEASGPDSHRQVQQQFQTHGYTLAAIHAGAKVPRLFLDTLPQDLKHINDVWERKHAFIRLMLPLILAENERILADRRQLDSMMTHRAVPDSADAKWLATVAARYRMPDFDARTGNWDELMRRVDIVPVSLAIAQGAIESGWGTSRFARLGNAIFGQWTWQPGTGMVPAERPAGAQYEVRMFDQLSGSVRTYLRNLNTHKSYADMRAKRAELRKQGNSPAGWALAGYLTRYSERGSAYTADLRRIIRVNRLHMLEAARLRPLEQAENETNLSTSS